MRSKTDERFLMLWLNEEQQADPIYKAIVAHLYSVLIHLFDDGNGKIARAINDYVLRSIG